MQQKANCNGPNLVEACYAAPRSHLPEVASKFGSELLQVSAQFIKPGTLINAKALFQEVCV